MNFKTLIFFLMLLSLTACSDDDDCYDLGEKFELNFNELICLEWESQTLGFGQTEHKYCPCTATCDIADELWVSVSLNGGFLFQVDTINVISENPPETLFGYKLSPIEVFYDGEKDAIPICLSDYDETKLSLKFSLNQN